MYRGRNPRKSKAPTKTASAYTRFHTSAYQAGLASAAGLEPNERTADHMREAFRNWTRQAGAVDASFRLLLSTGKEFRKGYAAGAGSGQRNEVLLPLTGSASAIVTVSNEEDTVSAVLAELERLPLSEIIVVLNGCTDRSFEAVRRHSHITLVHYPERLGHDVGRALGASAAGADILLFVDGDMVVPAEELARFLYAVDRGSNVALNDLSPWIPAFGHQDDVTRCKTFLNLVLGRPDLKANSMTAVPHALSRSAVQMIGAAALAVPPKAQALALLLGLSVTAPVSVNVIQKNRSRPDNNGRGNSVARMIIGDHLEALGEAMGRSGTRLRMTTRSRADIAKVRNSL